MQPRLALISRFEACREHTYPEQAAVNAAAFSSPAGAAPATCPGATQPTVALPPSLRGPAAPVVLSALRRIVRKCSASHDPRLACLSNVKQLDRIPPGSRAEAFGGVIVPRFRGDVHSDLTAVVARFSLPAGSSPGARQRSGPFSNAMARLRTVSSESSLANVSGSPQRPRPRRQNSRCGRADGPQPLARLLDSFRSPRHAHAASAEDFGTLLPWHTSASLSRDTQPPSPLRKSPHTPTASVDSAATERAAATSSPAALRWHAVRVYVRALAGEARLRQRLWREAVDAARSLSASPPPGAPASDPPGSESAPREPSSGRQSAASRRLDVASALHTTGSAVSLATSAQCTEAPSSPSACGDDMKQGTPATSRKDARTEAELSGSMLQLQMPSLVPSELDAHSGRAAARARGVVGGAWAGQAALAC